MEEFIKQLNFAGKNMYFLFSEIYVSKGRKFFVTTTIQETNVFFEMVCDARGEWRVIGPIPEFIGLMEREIIEMLRRHLAGNRQ